MTRKFLTPVGLILATLVTATASEAAPRPYRPLRHAPPAPTAADDVQKANAAARVMPSPSTFANAEQVYAFMPGALYQVYTSVGKVTDIALQPGERLVGTGPVAAGDTARWVIGTTESGTGDTRQVHILVKPTLPTLSTNLVINSDRRTYHIELQALPAIYMASVSRRYPQDELVAIAQAADKARAQTPIASAGADLPPLFLIGADGKAELVNYRVQGNFLIVDRLLDRAELRLGEKGHQKVVRIRRFGGQKS